MNPIVCKYCGRQNKSESEVCNGCAAPLEVFIKPEPIFWWDLYLLCNKDMEKFKEVLITKYNSPEDFAESDAFLFDLVFIKKEEGNLEAIEGYRRRGELFAKYQTDEEYAIERAKYN
jgi:predicted amidophosphoribosyltransferase